MLDLFLHYLPVISAQAMTIMYMLGMVTGVVFVLRTKERLGVFGIIACTALAISFSLVTISAGDNPVYPRETMLPAIRLLFLVGALSNICSHILYLLCFITVRKVKK